MADAAAADEVPEALARRKVSYIINEVLTTEKAYFASLKCMVEDWCVCACVLACFACVRARWLAELLAP